MLSTEKIDSLFNTTDGKSFRSQHVGMKL